MDAMRLELDDVRVEQLVGAGDAALGRPRLREILLVLGMLPDDDRFRELKEDDCKTMSENRKRGESRAVRSWLWADLSILSKDMEKGVKGFMVKRR